MFLYQLMPIMTAAFKDIEKEKNERIVGIFNNNNHELG